MLFFKSFLQYYTFWYARSHSFTIPSRCFLINCLISLNVYTLFLFTLLSSSFINWYFICIISLFIIYNSSSISRDKLLLCVEPILYSCYAFSLCVYIDDFSFFIKFSNCFCYFLSLSNYLHFCFCENNLLASCWFSYYICCVFYWDFVMLSWRFCNAYNFYLFNFNIRYFYDLNA